MVLGVYWYFDFPHTLYSYEFFTFRKGLGGHADAPAELKTTVETYDADKIIEELTALVKIYSDAFIFIYKSGTYLQIGTGGFNMHDYDFELALMVEQILKNNHVKKIHNEYLKDAELIKLYTDKRTTILRPGKKHFSMVGSPLRAYNAETSAIRFDCNVDENIKKVFLNEVNAVTASANIHVVYYLEKKYSGRYNLMLFFTNGRQGLGLKPKQQVDIASFESGMDVLIQQYGVQIGHIGGWDHYPTGNPVVLKMVDAEFILK